MKTTAQNLKHNCSAPCEHYFTVMTHFIEAKQKFDHWIDSQEVMQMLHISKRTLQTLRDNGTIPFSRINRKLFYYQMEDIIRILQDKYTMYNIHRKR